MVKKFLFRGKTVEELKSIPLDEFIKLLTSRERRALRRLSFEYRKLLAKVKKGKTPVKTRLREAVILPQWVGLMFAVHSGKEYKQFEIKPEMIGRRLGEFVHTTGRVLHSGPGVGATRGSKFMPLK